MVFREVIQKYIAHSVQRKGFDRLLNNVKVISAAEGKLSAELKVEESHTNPFGTLHGGYTATLVDLISTYALMTHPKFSNNIESFPTAGVSVDIHISYLKSAKIGEEIIINANTVKAGNNLAFLDVEICNKNTGQIIAKGSHTKFVG